MASLASLFHAQVYFFLLLLNLLFPSLPAFQADDSSHLCENGHAYVNIPTSLSLNPILCESVRNFLLHKGFSWCFSHFQLRIRYELPPVVGLPQWFSNKESACNAGVAGDAGSIPGSGRYPGRGHGNPLQYSCLENPMDRGAWRTAVHRVAKNQIRL